ncbi:MAG: hypothetical protein DRJ97_04265 [Thermoprotei archaeon]|nr:MAG: hypothetical protein DRJ97_04265 [Thermoprotei archaeon]
MKVKVVSFDLSGTLIDEDFVDHFWLEVIPRAYAEKRKLPLHVAKEEVLRMYEEVGAEDLRWYLPRYWVVKLGLGRLEPLLEEASKRIKVYDDVHEAFKTLARLKLKVAILTNLTYELAEICLRVINLSLPVTLLSCVTNFALTRKTRRFYELSCKALGVKPTEVVHVGNDQVYDLQEPASIGIKALLIDRRGGRDEGSINNLLELMDIVERGLGWRG